MANDNITSKVEQIDPVKARNWLKQNTDNRKLRIHRVEDLTAAILRGEWQLDGSPIRFSRSGKLLDGQHRLAAIEKAARTVPCLVVRGLPEEAQETMDRNLSRKFSDVLFIAKEPNATTLAASTALVWRYENRLFGKDGSRDRPSFPQLHDVLNRNPELRRSVQAAGSYVKKIKMPRTYLAAARTVLMSIDEQDADHFFSELMAGAELTQIDPIFRLREGLNQNAMSRSKKYSSDHLLGLMFKAWNLYRAGESVKNLSYRAGGAAPEPYPYPE
jgi:hypothetical protein